MPQRTPVSPQQTAGQSSARRAVERRSAAPLIFLRRLPPAALSVVAALLLIAGIAVRGPAGALALLLLAAFLGWIGYLSWPRLNQQGKVLRAVVIFLLAAGAAYQATR